MGGTAFAWGVVELVAFTTLAPAAAVAYGIIAARFLLTRPQDVPPVPVRALIAPLAIVTVGFVVSATHLGNPGNALYVLTRVGRAGLSNEVLSCGVFLALGGTFWIAALLHRPPKLLENLWLVATEAALVAYLVCTARVYCMPTIPTWNSAEAQACLTLEALAGGCLLARALLELDARTPSAREARVLLGCALAATAGACVALVAYHGRVSALRNVFGAGADLVPHYPAHVVLYGMCLLAGVALAWRADRREGRRRAALLCASAALMYGGTFLARFAFYATYLTLS